MMVFFKIFPIAEKPKPIENKWNSFGRKSGIVVSDLEVQVCGGSVARVANLGELRAALDLLV